jgi:hypothetical protein
MLTHRGRPAKLFTECGCGEFEVEEWEFPMFNVGDKSFFQLPTGLQCMICDYMVVFNTKLIKPEPDWPHLLRGL